MYLNFPMRSHGDLIRGVDAGLAFELVEMLQAHCSMTINMVLIQSDTN